MSTTATKSPTHIQRRREAASVSMRRVVYLLRTTDQSYCNIKFEYGMRWLESYLREDAEMISVISKSPIYWGWWKNLWSIREELFLQDAEQLQRLKVETRRKAWLALHNPKSLASELHPDSIVINLGYERMMQELMFDSKK